MAMLEWLRLGRWTAVLLGVVIFVLGALSVADRALVRVDRSRAQLDATESAALLESFIRVHMASLNAFRALYRGVPDGRITPEEFELLVDGLAPQIPMVRRLWVTDSTGVIRAQRTFGTPTPAMTGVDVDTVTRMWIGEVAARARATGRSQVSPPGLLFSDERGFALVLPILEGGEFRGYVGASITDEAALAAMERSASDARHSIAVLSGGDTVVAFTPRGGVRGPATYMGEAAAVLPGRGVWHVRVVHAATVFRARLALWAVAIGLLTFLVASALYERRAAIRHAERTRELERLSGELLRANRAKSEFLANVSHELRTPLNAIVGFVELLRDGVYGELTPRQVGPVDRIAASAAHLRVLVDQVLDLAKLAAARIEVHAEPVNLRLFALDAASEVEPLITEKGLNLSISVGATLPQVRTDPTLLRQVLTNLLSNAIKFTSEGGIAIRARVVGPGDRARGESAIPAALRERAPDPAATWMALQVSDTGMGIAPEHHERIFDEFEQVNAGSRGDSMQRGTGLGLAISRRLARLLGGELTVESEPRKGATFTIWLPLTEADLVAAERRRSSPREGVRA